MIFTLPPALLNTVVVGTVLPLLVGLLSTREVHPGVKAAGLALISLVSSLLTEFGASLAAGVDYDWGVGLLGALPTFLVAVGMHYGLWKPSGLSVIAQQVGAPAPKDEVSTGATAAVILSDGPVPDPRGLDAEKLEDTVRNITNRHGAS